MQTFIPYIFLEQRIVQTKQFYQNNRVKSMKYKRNSIKVEEKQWFLIYL